MAKTLDDFITQATNEIEAEKPVNLQIGSDVRELTDEEYTNLINQRSKAYYDAYLYDYIEARQVAYGSIGDQLDMQYKDLLDGTTTWKDHVAKVKSDNPKPE
jgi:hypothetical protein